MSVSRAKQAYERLQQIAECSERSDCLYRPYGTKSSRQVRVLVSQWLNEIEHMAVSTDSLLNVKGILKGNQSQLVIMGSHLDTVLNAGKFDGILGVVLAIDQAQRLSAIREKLPFSFEVIGFSEEEGLRFKKPYLGSLAVTGKFQKDWLNLTDDEGVSLGSVLADHDVNQEHLTQCRHSEVAAYFEVHIEQGPILEKTNLPVGLVTFVVGQQRHQITFLGEAGHAGTVPMSIRKDALTVAARFISEVQTAATPYPQMRATVGSIQVLPNISNVIPEKVTLSLDIRHIDQDELDSVVDSLRLKARTLAEQNQIVSLWENISVEHPIECDKELSACLYEAIQAQGLPVKELISGAGHDAVVMADIAPVSMLFIRCKNGISHNPLEDVSLADIEAAIAVCDGFFDNLMTKKNSL